jgi:hypothetical protein
VADEDKQADAAALSSEALEAMYESYGEWHQGLWDGSLIYDSPYYSLDEDLWECLKWSAMTEDERQAHLTRRCLECGVDLNAPAGLGGRGEWVDLDGI